MDTKLDLLDDPSTLIVFTTVPTGLGHIRVTDAITAGLPKSERATILGIHNKAATLLHRIASVNRISRKMTEWLQWGKQEEIFTVFFRTVLSMSSEKIYEQLTTLLDSRVRLPEKVLIISTHCMIAQQIAKVKKRIEDEKKVKIFLVVIVTDDSPQLLWYVANADLTFVPSRQTKESLNKYAKKFNLPAIDIIVNPYPVHPDLSKEMTSDKLSARERQYESTRADDINVSIPVSGAAVGLLFDRHIIEHLHDMNKRFRFYIIAKKAGYTDKFLSQMGRKDYVSVYSSDKDREVVDYYDSLIMDKIMSLEISKPSEQAFKTLLSSNQQGGVIMLFTLPVGRQEYDNLNFMERHGLIPDMELQEKLWEASFETKQWDEGEGKLILDKISKFRGLRLPVGSRESALFIEWCLGTGIFSMMFRNTDNESLRSHHPDELGGLGVEKFWQKVAHEFLKS